MNKWESLETWQKRSMVVLFFAGLFWGLFIKMDTPFHMDAEAAELWASSQREIKCKDAQKLDELILEADVRLATEQLSDEARKLITSLKRKREKEREEIRARYDC